MTHRSMILVLVGLAVVRPAAAAPGRAPELAVAERFDALMNAGKPAEAASLFTPDASAKTPEGNTLAGRDRISSWLGSLTGLHVDSGNRQAWEGGRVTWAASVSHDRLKALGVAPLAANAEATMSNGLITSLTLRFTGESRLKLTEAMSKEQEDLFRKLLSPACVDADLRAALPDLSLVADEVTAGRDRVHARGTLQGTWTGVYFGVTGTGQAVSTEFFGTAGIVNGVPVDIHVLPDLRSLQARMGFTLTHPALVPTPRPKRR